MRKEIRRDYKLGLLGCRSDDKVGLENDTR